MLNKPVVDFENNWNIDLIDMDQYSMMFDSIDPMLDLNVIVAVVHVVRHHLHDKHASDDYFQFLMFPIIHSVYHKYFDPKQ